MVLSGQKLLLLGYLPEADAMHNAGQKAKYFRLTYRKGTADESIVN